MLLFIDNYDSFSYNIVQYLHELNMKYKYGSNIKVIKNDELTLEEIKKFNITRIVLSPGPGRPEDSGVTMDVIDFYHKKIPILGICLGHQCLAEYFGINIISSQDVIHGEVREVFHNKDFLFENINSPIKQARYNSLTVDLEKLDVNSELLLSAYTKKEDKIFEVMAIRHKKYHLYGVQFHPESVLSEKGYELLNNFYKMSYV